MKDKKWLRLLTYMTGLVRRAGQPACQSGSPHEGAWTAAPSWYATWKPFGRNTAQLHQAGGARTEVTVILAEDVTVKGHTIRVLGSEDLVLLLIPFVIAFVDLRQKSSRAIRRDLSVSG